MIQQLSATKKSFHEALQQCTDFNSLKKLSLAYLGRKGIINNFLYQMVNKTDEEKKRVGKEINELKMQIEVEIKHSEQTILNQSEDTWIDVTFPGRKRKKGSVHLTTTALEEINHIFERLGFTRVRYREVEWEYFAFEALNMPKNHPARDDFETFFIEGDEDKTYGKIVLTPHTSSGQVREMMRVKKPPDR